MENIGINLSCNSSGFQEGMKAAEQSAKQFNGTLNVLGKDLDKNSKSSDSNITDTGKKGNSASDFLSNNQQKNLFYNEKADRQKLIEQIKALDAAIEKATQKVIDVQSAGNYAEQAMAGNSLYRLKSLKKQDQSELDSMNDPKSGAGLKAAQAGLGVIRGVDNTVDYARQGDVVGGGINALSTASSGVMQGGDVMKSLGASGGAIKGMMVAGIAGLAGALVLGGMNKLADSWGDQAPAAMNLFGSYAAGKNERDGTLGLRRAWGQAADAASAYGYDSEHGMSVMTGLAKYGVNQNKGAELTKESFRYARGFGMDADSVSQFAGQFQRYGGSGASALMFANGGAAASGLARGQMSEYMDAMKRILEDGISKGFIKGADQISGNMTLLSKLSGGSKLWSGEQGANRLMTMNNAISASTSLSSVTDILTFKAANRTANNLTDAQFEKLSGARKTEDENVNAKILMESGVNPQMLGAQIDMVRAAEGKGNREGQTARYMQMFGLNWTGATQIYDMANKSYYDGQFHDAKGNVINADTLVSEIKNKQSRVETSSKEQTYYENVERIKNEVVTIGQGLFNGKAGLTGIAANVSGIAKKMLGDSSKKIASEAMGDLYTGKKEKEYKEHNEKLLADAINSNDTNEQAQAQQFMDKSSSIGKGGRAYIDEKNMMNTNFKTMKEMNDAFNGIDISEQFKPSEEMSKMTYTKSGSSYFKGVRGVQKMLQNNSDLQSVWNGRYKGFDVPSTLFSHIVTTYNNDVRDGKIDTAEKGLLNKELNVFVDAISNAMNREGKDKETTDAIIKGIREVFATGVMEVTTK